MTTQQMPEEVRLVPLPVNSTTDQLTYKNIEAPKAYMNIAYSPTENKGAESV